MMLQRSLACARRVRSKGCQRETSDGPNCTMMIRTITASTARTTVLRICFSASFYWYVTLMCAIAFVASILMPDPKVKGYLQGTGTEL